MGSFERGVKDPSRPPIKRPATLKMNDDRWLKQIEAGKKTIEPRKATDYAKNNMTEGSIILIQNTERFVPVKIEKVTSYKSLSDLLAKEDVKKMFPGIKDSEDPMQFVNVTNDPNIDDNEFLSIHIKKCC